MSDLQLLIAAVAVFYAVVWGLKALYIVTGVLIILIRGAFK